MPAISVIIVNWNGLDWLPTCLASLEAQTLRDFEVILVDNASDDGSAAMARERFPWVRLVVLDRNYGFSGANNRGIEAARGRYIVLLNNDTESHPAFLQNLFATAETHPEIGLCASRMVQFTDRSKIDSCGIGLTVLGNGYPIGSGQPDGPAFNHPRYVFGACAGAALYRRATLDHIGLFDEDFESHVEDTDLSWRAQLAGYRCLYVPDAIVYHVGGATSRRISDQVLYRIQRNKTWAFLKNVPTTLLLVLGPLHLLYSIYWVLRAAQNGHGRIVCQAKWDAVRGWATLATKRRSVQSKRRISALSLLGMMTWHSAISATR